MMFRVDQDRLYTIHGVYDRKFDEILCKKHRICTVHVWPTLTMFAYFCATSPSSVVVAHEGSIARDAGVLTCVQYIEH